MSGISSPLTFTLEPTASHAAPATATRLVRACMLLRAPNGTIKLEMSYGVISLQHGALWGFMNYLAQGRDNIS